MNELETQRLTTVINAIRPDWPLASLRAWIAGNLQTRSYRDALLALTACASDPDTKTPARVLEPGPWWDATQTGDRSREPTRFSEVMHEWASHGPPARPNAEYLAAREALRIQVAVHRRESA